MTIKNAHKNDLQESIGHDLERYAFTKEFVPCKVPVDITAVTGETSRTQSRMISIDEVPGVESLDPMVGCICDLRNLRIECSKTVIVEECRLLDSSHGLIAIGRGARDDWPFEGDYYSRLHMDVVGRVFQISFLINPCDGGTIDVSFEIRVSGFNGIPDGISNRTPPSAPASIVESGESSPKVLPLALSSPVIRNQLYIRANLTRELTEAFVMNVLVQVPSDDQRTIGEEHVFHPVSAIYQTERSRTWHTPCWRHNIAHFEFASSWLVAARIHLQHLTRQMWPIQLHRSWYLHCAPSVSFTASVSFRIQVLGDNPRTIFDGNIIDFIDVSQDGIILDRGEIITVTAFVTNLTPENDEDYVFNRELLSGNHLHSDFEPPVLSFTVVKLG